MKTISIDLGGSRVKMGVVSDGSVTRFASIDSHSQAGLKPLLPEIEKICGKWVQEEPISSMGIAFPSLVHAGRKQIIGQADKFPDHGEVDLEAWAAEKFRLPMVLENDANAAALGKGIYGSAADAGDFILMILGTGIGTAAVMDGRLIRGRHYQAGNLFGHVPLKVHGRKCTGCPGVGCAEAQASTWALAHIVRESETPSPLKSEKVLDFRVLKRYYDAGDPLARSIFRECCDYWTNCLLAMICAYDPEVVVLSGGVMKWGPELFEILEKEVRKRAWTPWGGLRFRLAKDPEQSVLLGLHALCRADIQQQSWRNQT